MLIRADWNLAAEGATGTLSNLSTASLKMSSDTQEYVCVKAETLNA